MQPPQSLGLNKDISLNLRTLRTSPHKMAVPNPLGRLITLLINPRTLTSHASYPAYPLCNLFLHTSRRSFSSSPFLPSASSSSSSTAPAVLLVESPAKAKKIQEYLGPEYRVIASYGHIRDLPAKTGSVDPEQGFEMRWELADGAKSRVNDIAKAVKDAPRVYLATDPDREGEAISWHLVEELKNRGALGKEESLDSSSRGAGGVIPQRITFTEVTKAAVEAALASPREVSIPLVEAYMARRALDYLFGFNLSPLLWRKLPGARSAGRVQSVALRLIADREAAIEAFVPQQYWTVHAQVDCLEVAEGGGGKEEKLSGKKNKALPLLANLTSVDGRAPPSPGFFDESLAQSIRTRIEQSQFSVAAVTKKETSRNPPPPFTTSTLQQEANKRLGWGASRTMQYAQKLYEAGIITYMRTDGVSISPQAIEKIRSAVENIHGQSFLPEKPRFYATKSKNAQEAHEAIRPTNFSRPPSTLVPQGIEAPAVQLYSLIWSRALASQMASVRIQNVGADFINEDKSLKLRSTASHTLFPGYLAAYGFSGSSGGGRGNSQLASAAAFEDDTDGNSTLEGNEDNSIINTKTGSLSSSNSNIQYLTGEQAALAMAQLIENTPISVRDPEAAGHETRPPGRFTEGTLVKALEEAGVGRPSTYAPTLKLLQARRYLRKEGRALHPEPLGRVLSSFLCLYFPTYVDPAFTSRMEEELDNVSAGKEGWKELLNDFWGPFHARVGELASLTGTEVIDALNEELEILLFGKKKEELGESGQTGALDSSSAAEVSDEIENIKEDQEIMISPPGKACPSCGKPLSLKLSHRGGPFIGCTAYPECTYTRQAGVDIFGDRDGLALLGGGSGDGDTTMNGVDGTTNNLGNNTNTTTGQENFKNSVDLAEQYGLRGPARLIGKDTRGKPIFLRQGPYGPYAQLGSDTDHEMRRAPLPKNLNLRSVKLEYALSLLALPRTLGNHPETGEPVVVRNGKFGPYVSHKRSMRSLSKDLDPISITFEEALELLKIAEVMAEKKAARKKVMDDAAESKAKGGESLLENGGIDETGVVSKRGRKEGSTAAALKKKRKEKEERALTGAVTPAASASSTTSKKASALKKSSKAAGGSKKSDAISVGDEPIVMRARSAFQFFLQEEMHNYIGMPGGSRMKVLGEAWRALDDSARAPFLEKSRLDKQRVAVETGGLIAPGSVDWESLSATERKDMLHELRNRKDIVKVAQGVSPALRRPPTPYSLFMRDVGDKARQEQQSGSSSGQKKGSFMEYVATLWRELPGAEKQKYVEIAEKGQKEYMKARAKLMQGAQEL